MNSSIAGESGSRRALQRSPRLCGSGTETWSVFSSPMVTHKNAFEEWALLAPCLGEPHS
jgi:hypothetical protein